MGGEGTIEGCGGVSVRKAWLGDFLVADSDTDAVERLRLLGGWGGGVPSEVEGSLRLADDRTLRSV